ncbi:tryptophan synthase subunit alpha [Leuconostoc pseudomesenteroides]|uniref:tryptophan synthase subunit alpha n=1 Tax=Leuconostoc pseudomesenteroides TaxID=33968 RepID=UPI00301C7BDA
MNDITQALKHKNAFIGFTVAGYPDFEKSAKYIVDMANAGADLIEVGIAFSDPSADGPTIMHADQKVLANGTTTEDVFGLMTEVRKHTNVPLVFLTYTNPVFKYGYEKFLSKMKSLNIQGIIMPDMPLEEQEVFLNIAQQYGRAFIQLVTLQSGNRLAKIVSHASGFIYVVSSLGITGSQSELSNEADKIVTRIKELTDIPVAVGFGITAYDQAKLFSSADAIIVGSALVRIIEKHPDDATTYLTEFIQKMKGARNATNQND